MKIETVALSLVTLVVTVIVIALVAVPVIEDSATGSPYQGDNPGGVTAYYFDESLNFTIVRSGNNITTTIGGQTETYVQSGNVWPLVADNVFVRFNNNGTSIWENNTYHVSTVANGGDVTITCANGHLTITNSSQTLTDTTISFAMVKSDRGTWARYAIDNATDSFKATLGQVVYFGNLPNDTYGRGPARLYSVIDGGTPVQITAPYLTTAGNITNVAVTQTVDYQAVGGSQTVGDYGPVSVTWSDDDGTHTVTAGYYWMPIHYESTQTSSGGATGMNSVLLGIIPVLLFIVCIMIAVRTLKEA